MKTLILNYFGNKHEIGFEVSKYKSNNNLYVGMINFEEDWIEPWSDLTVNLDAYESMPYGHAYIDTNNNGTSILVWLTDNKLGKITGRTKSSGFCTYPEFAFDMEKLKEYIYEGDLI